MQRVWLITKRPGEGGFSVVEVLLAVAVFSLFVTASIGAIIYGKSATAGAGDRTRANLLAEEGLEAARAIRNSGYANLTSGTYGIKQTGGVWTLSGASDTTDIFTRSMTIADNGANRKAVTSNVSWSGITGASTTSVATELTNWMGGFTKSWTTPSQYGGTVLTGSFPGFKVATAGSYAYVVNNSSTGPNFFVISIATPAAPAVVGSLTLAGTPTNIAVSGNYAYVSNSLSSAELQIVDIATPTTPAYRGKYDANGTAGGRGVYAVGTTVYLGRAANGGGLNSDEFVVVNASSPTAPTRITGFSLNADMNEIYVNGTVAYVATSSDSQEVLVINLLLAPILSLGTSVDLTGTADATTIDGYGNTLVVGRGTTLYTGTFALALLPVLGGSLAMPGTINDVSADSVHGYAHVGTNYATGEFQVVNMSNPSAPVSLSSVDMTGSLNLTGVAYNATYDVTPGVNSSTAQGAVVFGPN